MIRIFSDFYCFVLFTKMITLTVFTEITLIKKEERNVSVNSQNEMCKVTKVA